jgi:hypothetical protein
MSDVSEAIRAAASEVASAGWGIMFAIYFSAFLRMCSN